jgi:tRNA(Ile)-lysidine synthase
MIPKSGNRFSEKIMPTQKATVVSATEAKSLFTDLDRFPALVLAVSGGPDSTALMWLAARWQKSLKKKPALVAVTIDHGLRAESAREAAAVKRLAKTLGIVHRTVRWRGRKPATGLQQAARQARYALLAQAARKVDAMHILTAHTLDDQAETVLIRMTRGSGLRGLTAMQRVTMLSYPSPERGGSITRSAIGVGSFFSRATPTRRASLADLPLAAGGKERNRGEPALQLVRPLLEIPKSRLVATLRAAKVAYAEDPSNRDPRFTRARLRGLMPELAREGLDAPRLSLLARRLKRVDAAIEAAVDRAMASLAEDAPEAGPIVFPAQKFAGLPAEIALRLIGRALARCGDEGPVELGKLEALHAALFAAQTAGQPRFRRTLAGAIVTLADGRLAVDRAPPRRRKPLTTRQGGRAKRTETR